MGFNLGFKGLSCCSILQQDTHWVPRQHILSLMLTVESEKWENGLVQVTVSEYDFKRGVLHILVINHCKNHSCQQPNVKYNLNKFLAPKHAPLKTDY